LAGSGALGGFELELRKRLMVWVYKWIRISALTCLRRWGQAHSSLPEMSGGGPDGVKYANTINPFMTLPQIAARLHAGTWKSLNAKLHRWRKINETPKDKSRL
jgi:hypothetical protein